MGAASCKSLKSTSHSQTDKNITVGVFGLDDAGKTSTVRALEGDPTEHVAPTVGAKPVTIKYPPVEKTGRLTKNKTQQSIKIIDVSGERRFRQQSWSQFYPQIHGVVVVIDASEKNRFRENQEMLDDLLEHDQLRGKPVLILANKQDQRGAVSNEYDLKRRLNIERSKADYKLILCSAVPQDDDNRVDESLQQGFAWLIQVINERHAVLNGSLRAGKQVNENGKNGSQRTKITSEKLPDINLSKSRTRALSEDDDESDMKRNGSFGKRRVLGVTNGVPFSSRNARGTETQGFRTTYESFPEETPWSMSSSRLKSTKSDELLSKLNTRSSLKGDSSRRDVSPLVRDMKPYGNGVTGKRDNHSDDEYESGTRRSLRSKPSNQFDTSPFSTNRFSSNRVKPTSSIYDDDDQNLGALKKPYSYSNGVQSTAKFSTKDYSSYSRYNDEDDDYDDRDAYPSSTKPDYSSFSSRNRFTASSKPTAHSKFEDDDDDDDDRKPDYSTSYSHYNGSSAPRSRFDGEAFFTSHSAHNSSSRSRKSTIYDN